MRSTMVWLCAGLVLCACDEDNGGPTTPRPAASVELALPTDAAMTSAGDTRSVIAVVKNADQSVVPSPSLTWTSDAPAVATVVGSGATATITAVGDGIAKITSAAGSAEGKVTITVRRKLASVVVTSPAPILTVGSTAQLITMGLDARGNPLPGLTGFTFASSNPGSVMVSNTGVMTALFAASRDRVCRAYTDPALVAQWWGRGNKLVIERMEVEKGGHWRYVEHSSDGVHGFEGRYREVTPQDRIVRTFEWDGMPAYVIIESATFEDAGTGKTKVTTTSLFHTTEERDGMLNSGMEGGMNESFEALDRLLAK